MSSPEAGLVAEWRTLNVSIYWVVFGIEVIENNKKLSFEETTHLGRQIYCSNVVDHTCADRWSIPMYNLQKQIFRQRSLKSGSGLT